MRVKLRYIGKVGWRSQDMDGTALSADSGAEVEMSAERAEKVLADYPRDFVRVGVEVVQSEQDTSEEPSVIEVKAVLPGDEQIRPRRRGRRE